MEKKLKDYRRSACTDEFLGETGEHGNPTNANETLVLLISDDQSQGVLRRLSLRRRAVDAVDSKKRRAVPPICLGHSKIMLMTDGKRSRAALV